MQFIFIQGAPGTGKSSVAKALHERLRSPWFEFGWIPEFREKQGETISFAGEELLAFDNLAMVAKNYARHGFENIILTDLSQRIMQLVPRRFQRYEWMLVTLTVSDDALLAERICDETRSSAYRNVEEALAINRAILARPLRANEVRFDARNLGVTDIVEQIHQSPVMDGSRNHDRATGSLQ